ncbi:MAG: peptidoglycan-binding domain-containing protein [Paracoccaceae bacterium]
MKRLIVVLCLTAAPALAQDYRAVAIGNDEYAFARDPAHIESLLSAAESLRGAGFQMESARNPSIADTRDMLAGLLDDTEVADRLVIVLAGHFAHSLSESWFLSDTPRPPDLAHVGSGAVSLTTVLDIAAQSPGGALVLLAGEDRRMALGAGLQPGLGSLDIPQGVAVISGDTADVAELLRSGLFEPGRNLAETVDDFDGLDAAGYFPLSAGFMPALGDTASPPTVTPAETAAWNAARAADSIEAYRGYLDRYPRGEYASAAQRAIEALRNDPDYRAMVAEDALNLSRDQRQRIQRDLSLLGFDPRGIDGLFGPGTRQAIRDWQSAMALPVTGYLAGNQVVRLSRDAEAKAALLAEEERRKQAEADRADNAYWDATSGRGEAGLRDYLARHPDGLHAADARRRLADIDSERERAASGRDTSTWERAQKEDTEGAYNRYLNEFPDGAFAPQARDRIVELNNAKSRAAVLSAAKQTEESLGLNAAMRRAVEGRLAAMGLEPGPVDGTFSKSTRAAIRRYQRGRGAEATGFLTQDDVVRLLVGLQ